MKLISLSEDMIRSINGIEILTFDDDGPILAYNIMGVGSYAEPLTDELREYLASLPLASPVRSYYFTDSVDDPSGVKIGQKTLLTNLPKELIRHIGERTIEKFTGEEVGCARCGARAKTTRVSDHEVIKENVCLNGHFGEVWAGGHRSLKQFSRCSRQIREITKSILTVGLCVPKKETSDHEFASTQLHALMTNSRYASVRNMSFNLQVTRRFTLVLSSGDDFGDYSLELLKELLNVTVNLHSLTIDLGDYSKRSHIQLLVPLDLHDLGNLTALKRLSVGKYDYEWISKCPNITHFATHGSHHNTCFDESWTNTGNTVKLLNALSTCKYLTSVDMDTTWTGDLLTRIFKNHPELTRLGMFGTWEYCFPVGLLGNPRRWNAKAPVPDTIGVFDPELKEALRKFEKLKTLILPHVQRCGIFTIKGSFFDQSNRQESLRVTSEESLWIFDIPGNEVLPSNHSVELLSGLRMFNLAYKMVAELMFGIVPNLEDLWFSRFIGVKPSENTDFMRDVCVTQKEDSAVFTIDREKLITRADDGRLPYGVGNARYTDADLRHFKLGFHYAEGLCCCSEA